MKIRDGFVSNSSSSSFIIGIKNVPLETAINEVIHDESVSIFKGAHSDFVETILANCNEMTDGYIRSKYGYDSIDSFLEEKSWESVTIKSLLKKGYTIYMGNFTDVYDDGNIENFLCNIPIEYNSTNFVMFKDAGY